MKRTLVVLMLIGCILLVNARPAGADGEDIDGSVGTIEDAVRVTVVKSGGEHTVAAVTGGSAGAREGCAWTLIFTPEIDDAPYGTPVDAKPDPDARFALLLCNGVIVEAVWIMPDDIVDLDALARAEADRYIEDVLVPVVHIGVNPAATGLVGLRSWFWIEGFDGSVTSPPISAFGLTIEVRMSSGAVTWDFGDGDALEGDLGRAYPEESTVQHAHQDPGDYTITAAIDLVPEYRVDGGPWLTLPDLQATATTVHAVQERQAVITET